ncbi:formamidopyrimidine-DNA glycosylase [Panacagrimonas perspica]|uniref:Formamidopyrimidine-DNA glycosylase n=1 Tax=Panacagrimonas perspica TaxID=381431 RepID=A0A4R7NYN8_9GAMM|nr:DNA-formamidopyrimidine glycosylase family protein [Panacagrimonas perspica]TDU25650.1 formamidopyrimidine-DNA glycosylase [Panacagrimonas perspica]THD03759.1 formamidopyrimidine-DNA glycosylase [Panacagrimonas perspica]
MPELPDLTVYLECLENKALGQTLKGLRIGNPFVLRSVAPRPAEFAGRRLVGTSRIGKRLVLRFEGDRCAIVHLMILGRLHWKKPGAAIPKGSGLCALDFESGTLLLTESGSKRRASLHLVESEEALAAFDRGGLEPLQIDAAGFAERLRRENHTLKRALTDPTIFAAIGNAYSDEILHRARLSPFLKSQSIDDASVAKLFDAVRSVLAEWTTHLRHEAQADAWPKKVTAFHAGMAVHGRYGLPCPVCGSPVQRIVYADNEANYCARCQTGGRLLADRALSRLLHDSWPKSIDDV